MLLFTIYSDTWHDRTRCKETRECNEGNWCNDLLDVWWGAANSSLSGNVGAARCTWESQELVLRQEFWSLEGLNGQSPKMTLINRLDILCIYIYVRVCVCVSALKTCGPTTKHLQVLFPLANWFLPETTLEQPLHTSMAQVDPFCCPLIVLGFQYVQPGWWELSLHPSAATMGPAGCETQGEREAFGWSVVLWSKLSTELRKKWIMCFFLGFS